MSHQALVQSVNLGGDVYAVRNNAIQIDSIDAWADPIRVVGNQRRGDRRNLSQWVKESNKAGFGYYVTEGTQEEGHPSFSGFFKSSLDTRFDGIVSLLPKKEEYTVESTSAPIAFFISERISGTEAVYAIPADNSSNISFAFVQEAATTFTSAGTTVGYYPTCEVITDAGYHLIFGCSTSYSAGGSPTTLKRIKGGVWSTQAQSGLAYPAWSVVNFKGILYAACFDYSNQLIRIYQSADDGSNWTAIGGMEIPSHYEYPSILGLAIYVDANGDPAIYLNTPLGLYLLDLSGNRLEQIISFPAPLRYDAAHPANVYGTLTPPVVWQGDMYIPVGSTVYRYRYDGTWTDLAPAGGRAGRPYESAYIDQIRGIVAGNTHLYVGMEATGYSKIFAYDGEAFHNVADWSITDINSDGDGRRLASTIAIVKETGQPTLWLFASLRNYISASYETYALRNLEVSPIAVGANVTRRYESAGELVSPWFDGGMTEVNSVLAAVGIGAIDLSANENVKIEVAINYSDTYESDAWKVKTFTSSTDNLKKYEDTANGVLGISAKNWRYKLTLNSGSASLTPVFQYPVFYYQKVFTDLRRYSFEIDIRRTMELNRSKFASPQDVMRSIIQKRDSIPLVKFSYSGTAIYTGGEDRYVRVEAFPHIARTAASSAASVDPQSEEMFVQLVVEEKL